MYNFFITLRIGIIILNYYVKAYCFWSLDIFSILESSNMCKKPEKLTSNE